MQKSDTTPTSKNSLTPPRKTSQASSQAKIVVVGDSAVGKSSLLATFTLLKAGKGTCLSKVLDDSIVTIGCDLLPVTLRLPTGRKVILQLWDTAGLERYRSLNKKFYSGAKAAIICFDLTKQVVLDDIEYWIDQVKEVTESSCSFMIVGTKSDLKINQSSVTVISEFCEENDVLFFQTSALTGVNVLECFSGLAERLMELNLLTPSAKKSFQIEPGHVSISYEHKTTPGSCCGC